MNKNEPSKKQKDFAEAISHLCDIPIPKEFTSYAYWKFINDNVSKYRAEVYSRLDETDDEMLPEAGYFC